MSEALLNFDGIAKAVVKDIVQAKAKAGEGSLIDLSLEADEGTGGSILQTGKETKARDPSGLQDSFPLPLVDNLEFQFQSTDPFAAGSPTKNLKLSTPLPTTNPVTESFNQQPGTLSSPLVTVTEQLSTLVTEEQISLVSPLSTPSQKSSLVSKSPSKIVPIVPIEPVSRLNPIPPALLPSHLLLPTRKWTDPSVFVPIPTPSDALGEIVGKCFSHLPVNQRPQRKSVTITQALDSADPYIPLITSNSWYAVASLARNDLIASHPIQVDEIMRLWFLRWTALLKLSKYDIVEKEMENVKARDLKLHTFDSFPDLFPGRIGCMIPFDILILTSLVPRDAHECLHRLYKLVYPEHPWDFSASRDEHYQILMHVVSVLIKIPDLELAVKVAKGVAEGVPENMDVLAMVGRLNLNIGDIDAARAVFLKIESTLGIPQPGDGEEFSKLPALIPRPNLVLSNRAFLLVAMDRYKEAIPYFTDLLALIPESESAINNLAMCHLYCGDVGQGSSFLESFLVTHPSLGGSRPEMIFNLTSMYDLTDSSLAKKRALLKVLVHGCGDDFDPAVMKL